MAYWRRAAPCSRANTTRPCPPCVIPAVVRTYAPAKSLLGRASAIASTADNSGANSEVLLEWLPPFAEPVDVPMPAMTFDVESGSVVVPPPLVYACSSA